MDWSTAITAAIQHRIDSHTFRQRRPLEILDATHAAIEGAAEVPPLPHRLINFASNNYLGLTHHPKIIRALESTARTHGVGSGAAGLITGHTEIHANAERVIAKWKNTESALLTTSGFTANLAAVQALASVRPPGGVRFLLDKLAHASLIDAVQNAGSFRVFPHNNLSKLRRLLEQADKDQLQVIVTESIFSMDGDAAELGGIVALKDEFPFLLLLDEAHASGVYGQHGAGYADELGPHIRHAIDLSIITLSKALGCAGGAICGSKLLIDAIVNFGRPWIFSTAMPPALAAAAATAIEVLIDEPQHQHRLRAISKSVRARLEQAGYALARGDSPIIPIILGEEGKTLAAAADLQSRGILTVAVRPPTVPRGSSRLRITLSSEHTDDELDQLISALIGLKRTK
jgi:8-amino-7-oxononanoate synthase